MENFFFTILTQTLTFFPLALGISISYTLLRATDMTLDGSFVLGAAIFARLVTLGVSPYFAVVFALFAGGLAGCMVSLIQKGGQVDPLLAGVLATFILTSGNLALMGRPNINLLSTPTLFSTAFERSEMHGWLLVAAYCFFICIIACLVIRSHFGLILRALGDNPILLQRLGFSIEIYRLLGFALTNTLAAASGLLTAQTIGYADIGMGVGMTLTGIGAIILGQQIMQVLLKSSHQRIFFEFSSCLIGVLLYFFALNGLLRLDISPTYLKMLLGFVLILFLRTAVKPKREI